MSVARRAMAELVRPLPHLLLSLLALQPPPNLCPSRCCLLTVLCSTRRASSSPLPSTKRRSVRSLAALAPPPAPPPTCLALLAASPLCSPPCASFVCLCALCVSPACACHRPLLSLLLLLPTIRLMPCPFAPAAFMHAPPKSFAPPPPPLPAALSHAPIRKSTPVSVVRRLPPPPSPLTPRRSKLAWCRNVIDARGKRVHQTCACVPTPCNAAPWRAAAVHTRTHQHAHVFYLFKHTTMQVCGRCRRARSQAVQPPLLLLHPRAPHKQIVLLLAVALRQRQNAHA